MTGDYYNQTRNIAGRGAPRRVDWTSETTPNRAAIDTGIDGMSREISREISRETAREPSGLPEPIPLGTPIAAGSFHGFFSDNGMSNGSNGNNGMNGHHNSGGNIINIGNTGDNGGNNGTNNNNGMNHSNHNMNDMNHNNNSGMNNNNNNNGNNNMNGMSNGNSGMNNNNNNGMSNGGYMDTIGPDIDNNLPPDMIEDPTTLEEVYRGSMKALLMRNIGNYVVATFLIGTQGTVSWEGVLYDVGNDYLAIYQTGRDQYIVSDLYSLKYVEFYDTQRRVLCDELINAQEAAN